MNYGKIIGESSADYHDSGAVGSHKLADFVRSPLLYYRRHISKEAPPAKSSDSKEFGLFFHALALEGESVAESRHIILPNDAPDRPTEKMRNAKKQSDSSRERCEWWDEFNLRAAGKIITTQADSDLAWRMVEAVRAKPLAVEFLKRGVPEVTFRKKMSSFSVQCRCDWWDEVGDEHGRPLIIDVKTIDSLDDFDRQYLKFGYYKQDALYRLVVNATLELGTIFPRFLFLVCEKNEPFQVAIREPDAIAYQIGTTEIMRDLTRLKACYDNGDFPGEPNVIQPVSLPDWKIASSMP